MTQAGTRSATPSAVPRFTRLEAVDPADVARDRGIDPLAYLPDMDVTDSPVLDELLARAAAFDFDAATEADVRAALAADRLSPEGFGALLSPAAEPLLEELAAAARRARRRWFGSTAYLFTPLYLANYCDNHCVYCGFNRDNDICRARLDRHGVPGDVRPRALRQAAPGGAQAGVPVPCERSGARDERRHAGRGVRRPLGSRRLPARRVRMRAARMACAPSPGTGRWGRAAWASASCCR